MSSKRKRQIDFGNVNKGEIFWFGKDEIKHRKTKMSVNNGDLNAVEIESGKDGKEKCFRNEAKVVAIR
ncbi:hypothetical protein KKA15_05635 [Patescibacteria group bacterium]|nr:hypothetical protein [Patescibacteria group bacterium]